MRCIDIAVVMGAAFRQSHSRTLNGSSDKWTTVPACTLLGKQRIGSPAFDYSLAFVIKLAHQLPKRHQKYCFNLRFHHYYPDPQRWFGSHAPVELSWRKSYGYQHFAVNLSYTFSSSLLFDLSCLLSRAFELVSVLRRDLKCLGLAILLTIICDQETVHSPLHPNQLTSYKWGDVELPTNSETCQYLPGSSFDRDSVRVRIGNGDPSNRQSLRNILPTTPAHPSIGKGLRELLVKAKAGELFIRFIKSLLLKLGFFCTSCVGKCPSVGALSPGWERHTQANHAREIASLPSFFHWSAWQRFWM